MRSFDRVTGVLFVTGIVLISEQLWWMTFFLFLLFLFIRRRGPDEGVMADVFLGFLSGFALWQGITNQWEAVQGNHVLERILLILILLGIYFPLKIHKKEVKLPFQLPDWKRRLDFPYHSIKASSFLLIGLFISLMVFIPTLIGEPETDWKLLFGYGLLFSIVNALLEEWIWRGVLFASLKKYGSVTYAIIITSLGFGLIHLSIGFSLLMSLLFVGAGFYYAVLVWKTESLYPPIVFHWLWNMGMVSNGWIFS
ncbi:CPBP family intramembrane glutamic endopeptidase [Halobacillus faecis]